MHLRKLYRTIETLASQSAENEEQILANVIHAIIHSEAIKINGGRLWKIHPKTNSYILKYQEGDIEKIKKEYLLRLKDYPIFYDLPKIRTFLAKETDQYLRKKGVKKYSATGVGEKILVHNKLLYKYILAFNSEHTDDTFLDTLNIISVSLTNVLKSRKIEIKAKQLQQDIDKASDIQKSILPAHEIKFHPESFRDEIYGISIPDRIVGGDFFDYLQTTDEKDRLGVVIGDAASKGLSAAAQALYVSGALRMGFGFQIKMNSLISKINNLLNRVFNEANFVTLFYAELTNDKRGLMIFTNAGHNNPILYRPAMDSFEFLETTGQILGPFLNEKYATESTLMGLSKPVMRTMKCLAKTD
ncbi:MAG: SpoIIE family protein phosphatase [Bacteroidetes bacterium]|nr:SpoIIE family protein phosphatase [Bacteroidota bacterium]MBU1422687.1 SpoIIE family protein phosphatase [Bacteroidota bacterium]MBU2472238.1 SpoIIE family protein phosphatase [Bacteroidota bacterium]MBU2636540.1 SpoIIE family protein phosphatase [Bacteroidota bacterium]